MHEKKKIIMKMKFKGVRNEQEEEELVTVVENVRVLNLCEKRGAI